MKTLKISDQLHAKLTSVLGQLMAETGKSKTYEDAVEAVINRSVVLPPDLLRQIDDFIGKNKQFGYATKEEFLKDAARFRMEYLTSKCKNLDASKSLKQTQ